MPSEFRFLLICLSASRREDDGHITLSGIVNTVDATIAKRLELAAVIGLVLRPEMQGKRLDLMAWRLGKSGERLPLPGYAGTPLILPQGLGPDVLPFQIAVPIQSKGIYGFELFDREGAFGPQEQLLATYIFAAN
jgi:hypothetical protein